MSVTKSFFLSEHTKFQKRINGAGNTFRFSLRRIMIMVKISPSWTNNSHFFDGSENFLQIFSKTYAFVAPKYISYIY